jgi:hypothetical protein
MTRLKFALTEVHSMKTVLALKEPFILVPKVVGDYMVFEKPEIGFHIITRSDNSCSEVMTILAHEMEILWLEYGIANDEQLSPKAIEVKNNLRSMIQEESLKAFEADQT